MEFACPACGSSAVVYPDRLADDAPVRCRRCQIVRCTVRELRHFAEDGMARIELIPDRWRPNDIVSGLRFGDRLFRRLTYFLNRLRPS
jgi:hypothetical protein